MRVGDVTDGGDVDEDREKLFPENPAPAAHPGDAQDENDVDHAE